MKKKTYTALFAISLVAVLAASVSVILRIALYQEAGRREARENFSRLSALLAPVRESADLGQQGIRADLSRFYRESPALLLVSVYERGAGVRWRMPARSDYLPARENVEPIPQPRYSPQSAFLLAAPLSADTTGRLAVDAVYVILPQIKVFEAFRDAALGLAAVLVALAILLLVEALSGRAVKPGEEAMQTASSSPEEGPDAEAGLPPEYYATAPPSMAPGQDDDFVVPDLSDTLSEGDFGADATGTGTRSASQTGLFSPVSGLGWEAYLGQRLDAELARSASFEQDLSLLLVSWPGLARGGPEYSQAAGALADFFSFKDLAFERGTDGFAVILPNIDADHALRMAEEFIRKLAAGAGLALRVGISSRAGRLVDAAQLSHEADVALRKAGDEKGSHIVAFKPDPDRYRIYLASRAL